MTCSGSVFRMVVMLFASWFFSLWCCRFGQSSNMCLTVVGVLHLLHVGVLLLSSRCLWVSAVWPILSLLRMTDSRRVSSLWLLG
jgi:hypothetical protein